MATYKAGQLGLSELITASTKDSSEIVYSGEANIDIKVPGFVEIQSGFYRFLGGGSTCDKAHNPYPDTNRNSIYLTPAARHQLLDAATRYYTKYQRRLSLNDASLPFGGLFDNGGRESHCHQTHKTGIDVDLNRRDADGGNLYAYVQGPNGSTVQLVDLLTKMVQKAGGCRFPEGLNRIHYAFTKEKEGCNFLKRLQDG